MGKEGKAKMLMYFGLFFWLMFLAPASVLADGVVLVEDSFAIREDIFGRVRFLGEVKNELDVGIYHVKITFTTKDKAGKVLSVDRGYINGSTYVIPSFGLTTDDYLAPGEVGAFEVSTSVPMANFGSYTYKITWDYAESPTGIRPARWGGIKAMFR
ncbi:MAG TPA: hypothetical protein EYP59_06770 [Thiotrichaceae bacterium]|nr:hypothetical protein [Thiotrichaceae bacterium]